MAQPINQMRQPQNQDDRSLGDLFAELASETSQLVRQEVALAQTEITNKATRVGKQVGFLVVGGAIGYAALLVILAAITIGLARIIAGLTNWTDLTSAFVAALVVGVIVGIVAYVLITNAVAKLKAANLAPNQTIESVKEDAQWLKNQVS
ncbi:MAG: phage holin family protein [Acidobacteriota bacterium]|nr:phage holin family protein [Acidobacteriota bacterium]